MPFYEFECNSHGVFEVWHSIKEDHATDICPQCKQSVKRVFSVPVLMGDLPTINRAKAIESEANIERMKDEQRLSTDA